MIQKNSLKIYPDAIYKTTLMQYWINPTMFLKLLLDKNGKTMVIIFLLIWNKHYS